MTVNELLQVICRVEFIDIEGDTRNDSPYYIGRSFQFCKDHNYKILKEMLVVDVFLLEDPDDDEHRVYGFKIYYDDMKLGLEDEI